MKYILNIIQDVEEVLTNEIKSYLFNEVKFSQLYPHFGNVRVSGTHPFAFLIDQEINNTKLPTGLFPSITVVTDSDQKSPQLDITVPLKDVDITSAEIDDIKNNRNKYSISNGTLQILEEMVNNAQNNKLYAQGVETYRRGSTVIEIWSENPKIKNKLYDLMQGFLIGIKRFTIKENYNIVILEESISGEKSGNYNFDFGKILYAGIVRFSVDYPFSQYIIDTESQVMISGITHTYTEVKANE